MGWMQRVMVYVDGFNLYFGLRSKGWRRYYWADLRRLAENLLRPEQTLIAVRYFSARISALPGHLDKWKRQATYLEALETLPDFHIHFGHYLAKPQRCNACGATWDTHEEKMTDVNIVVELLGDTQDDSFDMAMILFGDSDLATAVQAFRPRYPAKRVVIAFPPARNSVQFRKVASGWFRIGRKTLKDSQFPDQVVKADGFALRRPEEWH